MQTKNDNDQRQSTLKNIGRQLRTLGSRFKYVLLFVLAVTATSHAQNIDVSTIVSPLHEGDRALRFRINLQGANANDLDVTVFYSARPSALNNLQNHDLFSGKPVLTRLGSGQLAATFVFTHHDQQIGPNRALYLLMRDEAGTDVIRYDELERFRSVLQTLRPGQEEDFLSQPSPIDQPIPADPFTRDTCVYYRIQVRTRQTTNSTSVRMFRMPGSFTIALLGDSYSAGEGAPDKPGIVGAEWASPAHHRSNNSGNVRGVKAYIAQNPNVSVSWTHQASSGALTDDLPEQFRNARNRFAVRGQEGVHLALFSMGGNNAGFPDIVKGYLYNPMGRIADIPGTPLNELEEILENMRDDIGKVTVAYNRFAVPTFSERQMFGGNTESSFYPMVSVMTYPDPTFGPYGRCGTPPPFPKLFPIEYSCCPYEVNPVSNPVSDYSLISSNFIKPLNRAIRRMAEENHWRVIDVEDAAGRHGICNCVDDFPWYNLPATSIRTQGDIYGTMHPTSTGYRKMYEEPVARAITAAHDDFVAARSLGILLGLLSPPEVCDANASVVNEERMLQPTRFWQLQQELGNLRRKEPIPSGTPVLTMEAIFRDPAFQAAFLKGDLTAIRALSLSQQARQELSQTAFPR